MSDELSKRRPRRLKVVAAMLAALSLVALGAYAVGRAMLPQVGDASPPKAVADGSDLAFEPAATYTLASTVSDERTRRNVYVLDSSAVDLAAAEATAKRVFGFTDAEKREPAYDEDSSYGNDDMYAPQLSVFGGPSAGVWYGNAFMAWEECADHCQEPSEQAAKDELIRLMQEFGFDPAQFAVSTAVDEWDPGMIHATANYVIDGDEFGLGFSVSMTKHGLESFDGPLARLVDLGEYPVVSEQDAFARLTDPRFGSIDRILPDDYWERMGEFEVASDAVPLIEEGQHIARDGIPWGYRRERIESIRLGWSTELEFTVNPEIVPIYFLRDENGVDHAVVALAEESLELVPW